MYSLYLFIIYFLLSFLIIVIVIAVVIAFIIHTESSNNYELLPQINTSIFDSLSIQKKFLCNHFLSESPICNIYLLSDDNYYHKLYSKSINNKLFITITALYRNKLFIKLHDKPFIFIRTKLEHYKKWYIFVHLCILKHMEIYYLEFCKSIGNVVSFLLILFDNDRVVVKIFIFNKSTRCCKKYCNSRLKKLVEYLSLINHNMG